MLAFVKKRPELTVNQKKLLEALTWHTKWKYDLDASIQKSVMDIDVSVISNTEHAEDKIYLWVSSISLNDNSECVLAIKESNRRFRQTAALYVSKLKVSHNARRAELDASIAPGVKSPSPDELLDLEKMYKTGALHLKNQLTRLIFDTSPTS